MRHGPRMPRTEKRLHLDRGVTILTNSNVTVGLGSVRVGRWVGVAVRITGHAWMMASQGRRSGRVLR